MKRIAFLLVFIAGATSNLFGQNFKMVSAGQVSQTIKGADFKANLTPYTFTSVFSGSGTLPLASGPGLCQWGSNLTSQLQNECVEVLVDNNLQGAPSNYEFKELRAYLHLFIDHEPAVAGNPIQKFNPYVYVFKVKVRGFKSIGNCTAPGSMDEFTEYLVLSYTPDGNNPYQDKIIKSYYGYYSLQAQIEDIYDVTNLFFKDPANSNQLVLKNTQQNPYDATPTLCEGKEEISSNGDIIYCNGFRHSTNTNCQASNTNNCWGDFKTNWKFEAGISAQKFVKTIPSGLPSTIYSSTMTGIKLTPHHTAPTAGQTNHLKVEWDPLNGNTSADGAKPVMYELEWTYVDNYAVDYSSGTAVISEKASSNLEYNFLENATRIITDKTFYDIPLIYKKGYIVYRVRMLRPDDVQYKQIKYSDWSISTNQDMIGNLSNPSNSYFKITDAHVNDDKNWNYQVSFAEEGKSKGVVSYFDGLLRNRQSVTKFGSISNQLIATAPIYNYEGQAVLQTLPIPIKQTTNQKFEYQSNFLDPTQYTPNQIDDKGQFNPVAPINSTALASKYYSTSNPNLGAPGQVGLMTKAIPDAEGFPLIHTIYTKDDPKKVKRQGGAGQSLQINQGHETMYYYMEPTQDEITKYHGLNVGKSTFYDKTITQDPNGQYSFSIGNNKGQPIMTGLMKKMDPPVSALSPILPLDHVDQNQATVEETNLLYGLEKKWDGTTLRFNKTYFSETNTNGIKVGVELPPYLFCSGQYGSVPLDLNVDVMEETGNLVSICPDPNSQTYNSSIINLPPSSSPFYNSQTFQFPPSPSYQTYSFNGMGEMVVDYSVSYDPDKVESLVKTYLGQFNAFTLNGPTSSCLLKYDDALNESIAAMGEPCAYLGENAYSECAEYREIMKMHMRPGNQYAKYAKLGEQKTLVGNDSSIFKIVGWNDLNNTSVITSNLTAYTGHNPEFYLNIVPATYPAQSNCSTLLNAALQANQSEWNGKWGLFFDEMYKYFKPVYWYQANTSVSLNVSDFIENFDEDLILTYHPEFCILNSIYCDDLEGMRFAQKLSSLNSYAEAETFNFATLSNLQAKDPMLLWATTKGHSTTNAFKLNINYVVNCSFGTTTIGSIPIDDYALFQTLVEEDETLADFYACAYSSSPGTFKTTYLTAVGISSSRKNRYFEIFKTLYLTSRRDFPMKVLNVNSFLPCQGKLQLVNESKRVFKQYLPGANNGIDLNTFTSDEKSQSNNQTKLGQLVDLYLNVSGSNPSVTAEITDIEKAENEKIRISYADYIMHQLENCLMQANPTSLALSTTPGQPNYLCDMATNPAPTLPLPTYTNRLNQVRSDLVCIMRMNANKPTELVWKGGITPDLLKRVLETRGILLDDLCNPFLISYDQSSLGQKNFDPCDLTQMWYGLSLPENSSSFQGQSALHQLPQATYDLMEHIRNASSTQTSYSIPATPIVLNSELNGSSKGNHLDEMIFQSLGLQGTVGSTCSVAVDVFLDCGTVPNLNTVAPFSSIGSQINAFNLTNCTASNLVCQTCSQADCNYCATGFIPRLIEYNITNSINSKTIKMKFTPTQDLWNGYYRTAFNSSNSTFDFLSDLPHLYDDLIKGNVLLSNSTILSDMQLINGTTQTDRSGKLYFIRCQSESSDPHDYSIKALYVDNNYINMSGFDGVETYVYTFDVEFIGLDIPKPENNCITAYEFRYKYPDFINDVVTPYQIKGEGHPYHEEVLTNYYNYHFRKDYSSEQYGDLTKGANLASYHSLPKYLGYFQARGTSNDIDNLVNWLQTYTVTTSGSGNTLNVKDMSYVRYQEGQTEYFYLNAHSIFKDGKLRPFLMALSSYLSGVSAFDFNDPNVYNRKAHFNRLENEIYSSYSPNYTFLLKENNIPTTPPTINNATQQSLVPINVISTNSLGNKFIIPFYKMVINLSGSASDISKATYEIENQYKQYLDVQAYTPLRLYNSTMTDDNLQSAKLTYLSHMYSTGTSGNATYNQVIDNVKIGVLSGVSGLNSFNYLSYVDPLTQGSRVVDEANYVGGTLFLNNTIGAQPGKDFLMSALTAMKRSNLSSNSNIVLNSIFLTCQPNSQSIFYDYDDYDPANTPIGELSFTGTAIGFSGNYKLIPRRQDENIYWFKIRKVGTTLNTSSFYNVYIKIPEYITHDDLLYYQVDNVTPICIEGGTKAFKITFSTAGNACVNANSFTAYGRTDFALDGSTPLVFNHVMICDGENPSDLFNPCFEEQLAQAEKNAKAKYQQYLDYKEQELITAVNEHIKTNLKPIFWLQMEKLKYAITLYNYDRAGNLVQTTPPAGVTAFSTSQINTLDNYRETNTSYATSDAPSAIPGAANTVPQHVKNSKYRHNSLNQLIWQKTPDGGETTFYYDPTGKLVLSQNSKQATTSGSMPIERFSYTLYDKQNRIIETGEVDRTTAILSLRDKLTDYNFSGELLDNTNEYIANIIRGQLRREVVRTFYDNPLYDFSTIDNGMSDQTNLRGRVACIANYPAQSAVSTQIPDNPLNNIQVAIHYSYDMSGNVQTLTYDMPELAYLNQRYKRIDYDYDLYSGKVTLVSYNRGSTDQFYQRYQYDDDNRITLTETSPDGILWDKDAKYTYYDHGPLARVELGDLGVQGIDFAYTLQGWLKSINGDKRNPANDIGGDGLVTGLKADKINHALFYYNGDYKPLDESDLDPNTSNEKLHFVGQIPADRSLYNGNIAGSMTAPGQFESLYTDYWYDQLNRIKRADYKLPDNASGGGYNNLKYFSQYSNGGLLSSTGQPSGITVDSLYRTEYWYDLDGNLERLRRFTAHVPGTNPSPLKNNSLAKVYLMDNIDYKYDLNAHNNKLYNYAESIDHSTQTTDPGDNNDLAFNNQSNYISGKRFDYDQIGNLILDHTNPKQLTKIAWSLYGKVLGIDYGLNTNTRFGYEPGGNRFKKTNIEATGQDELKKLNEYYIREASGNILAIYKQRQDFAMKNPFAEMVTALKGDPAFPTTFASIFHGNAEFTEVLGTFLIEYDRDQADALIGNYTPEYYLYNNANILSNVVHSINPFVSDLMLFDATIAQDAMNSYEEEALMPMLLETEPNVQDDFLELLSCNANPDIMTAIVQGIDPFLYPNDLEEFKVLMTDILTYTNHEVILEAFENVFVQNPEYWSQLIPGLLTNSDYLLREYSGYAPGNFENFVKSKLTAMPEPLPLVNYLSGLPGIDNIVASISEKSERIQTIFNTDPAEVFSFLLSNNSAEPVMQDICSNLSSVSFTSLCSELLQGPLSGGVSTLLQEVLVKDKYYLAEHHLYGSSRLGIKNYWSSHYSFLFDKEEFPEQQDWELAVANNQLLTMRRPWYSQAYNSLIKSNKTLPWGNANTDEVVSTRLLGQKSYELTNHLGNVMAVVSDKVVEIENPSATYTSATSASLTAPTDATQDASIKAAYDYYPFGMLMPERYYEDVEKQCSPVTRSLYATNWVNEEDVIMAYPGVLATFTLSQDANAVIAEDGSLHVTAENPNNRTTEISKVLDIIPANKQFSIKTHITNSGQSPIFMQVLQMGENNQWITLASRTISVEADVDLVSFSKSNTNPLKVLFSTTGATNFSVYDIQLTRRDVLEMEITENLCSYDEDFGDDYRFGFNGMHKDNEVKGIGNSLDFGARIYDSRLGRWLSVDPLQTKYPGLSPYIFVGNNPIIYVDPDGRKIVNAEPEGSQERIKVQRALDIIAITNKELYEALDKDETIIINVTLGKLDQPKDNMIDPANPGKQKIDFEEVETCNLGVCKFKFDSDLMLENPKYDNDGNLLDADIFRRRSRPEQEDWRDANPGQTNVPMKIPCSKEEAEKLIGIENNVINVVIDAEMNKTLQQRSKTMVHEFGHVHVVMFQRTLAFIFNRFEGAKKGHGKNSPDEKKIEKEEKLFDKNYQGAKEKISGQ